MFAILETGGKQYRVSEGSVIDVEKLEANKGEKIILGNVLLIQKNDGELLIGQPIIQKATIEAEVTESYRNDKIIVFKKRRRKNSRRKNGHRQDMTELRILNIKA